jgi:hypothetical protein
VAEKDPAPLAYPGSLCHTCGAPPRRVTSDRGSVFLFCPLLKRYPVQPVRDCDLYTPARAERGRDA